MCKNLDSSVVMRAYPMDRTCSNIKLMKRAICEVAGVCEAMGYSDAVVAAAFKALASAATYRDETDICDCEKGVKADENND